MAKVIGTSLIKDDNDQYWVLGFDGHLFGVGDGEDCQQEGDTFEERGEWIEIAEPDLMLKFAINLLIDQGYIENLKEITYVDE